MESEKLEVMRGSGNIFRALDREGLSVRAAHGCPGIAAADFSRIRNADLGRITFDLKPPHHCNHEEV